MSAFKHVKGTLFHAYVVVIERLKLSAIQMRYVKYRFNENGAMPIRVC